MALEIPIGLLAGLHDALKVGFRRFLFTKLIRV